MGPCTNDITGEIEGVWEGVRSTVTNYDQGVGLVRSITSFLLIHKICKES